MNSRTPPGLASSSGKAPKDRSEQGSTNQAVKRGSSMTGERSLVGELVGRLEVRMLGLALLLGIVLTILSPHFLTSNNLLNVLDQSVVVGIVAIGMTFVILIGGIDLSVGSVAGCTGVLLGRGLEHLPIPLGHHFGCPRRWWRWPFLRDFDRPIRAARVRSHLGGDGDWPELGLYLFGRHRDRRST